MKIETNDIESQTLQVIHNLKAVLKKAGLTLSNVVKANVFLSNMENFQKINIV